MPAPPCPRLAAGASACLAIAAIGVLAPHTAAGAGRAEADRPAASVARAATPATPRAALRDASTAFIVFSRRSADARFSGAVRSWVAANPDVRFVAVGYGMGRARARAVVRSGRWSLPVVADPRGTVTRRMLVRNVPSLVTVEGDGDVHLLATASRGRHLVARPLTGRREPVLPVVPKGAPPVAPAPAADDPAPAPRSRPSTPAPAPSPSPSPSAPAPDRTGPTLSATWPASGTTLSAAVGFVAKASDPSGIARVEMLVDGTLRATELTAPYDFRLDPGAMEAGAHTVALRARDKAGNTATISRSYVVPAPPPAAEPPPAPAPPPSGGTGDAPLWSDSFENGWNKYGAGVGAGGATLLESGGQGDNGRTLRITHPAGAYYGLGWYPKFNALGLQPMEDVHFRYWIRPWENYHFRLEAKIPGLGGGNFPTGCGAADPSKGWSGRLQWGQVANNTKGRIQTYLYTGHPSSNTGGCGFKEFWQAGAELEPGTWACIEMRYRMNTPGSRDGIMQGWFNGQLRYDRRDILFRSTSSLKTDILAAVFYHGGTEAWQPIKTEYVDFDSLAISDRFIGCG